MGLDTNEGLWLLTHHCTTLIGMNIELLEQEEIFCVKLYRMATHTLHGALFRYAPRFDEGNDGLDLSRAEMFVMSLGRHTWDALSDGGA